MICCLIWNQKHCKHFFQSGKSPLLVHLTFYWWQTRLFWFVKNNYAAHTTEQYIALNLKETLIWNELKYFPHHVHECMWNKSPLKNDVDSNFFFQKMCIPLCFTRNFRVVVTRIQNLRFYGTLQKGVLSLWLYASRDFQMHSMQRFWVTFATLTWQVLPWGVSLISE